MLKYAHSYIHIIIVMIVAVIAVIMVIDSSIVLLAIKALIAAIV